VRWCVLCGLALAVSPAIAQDERPAAPAPAAASGLVSLNVRDADIHGVLATFARRFDISISADPEIQCRVTVMVENVPWEAALMQVLDACDLSYVEEGDSFKVARRTAVAPAQAARTVPETAAPARAALTAPEGDAVPAQAARTVPETAAPARAALTAPEGDAVPAQAARTVPETAAPARAALTAPEGDAVPAQAARTVPETAAPVPAPGAPLVETAAETGPLPTPVQVAAGPSLSTKPLPDEAPGAPPPDAAPTPTASPVVGVKAVPTPAGIPASGKVTFDFKDADIVNILRIFSMRYGINVIAGPEVQGKVTIRLVDVPWESALKLILESNNYSYVKQNNVFRVLSRDQLDKEPLDTKVFALSYAQAKDVANSIQHLLTPQRGQLKPDDRSNTLVVTDIPKRLNEIEEVIERLDRRTPQVMIEARILELKDDFDENIGINWVALKGYNVNIGPPQGEGLWSIVREETRGREDTSADIYSNILNEADTRKRTSTSTDSTSTTFPGGTTISTTDGTTSERSNISTRNIVDGATGIQKLMEAEGGVGDNALNIGELSDQPYGVNQGGRKVMTTELTQAVLTPDNFQLTLNFLQEQTDASLISHPKIVTADNKDSVMKVADQWPIPNFQFNNDTGQWEISNFTYKDIGIVLKVKPHVNEDEYINMRVVPEVSDILSFTTFGGATNAQLPVISTRTAETDVLIRNGQTLAIGGLMREDESAAVTKLPLLGEIPYVGPYLFSNSTKRIRNSNILIFVTANVVTEENKDSLWMAQREEQNRQLNIPKTKWWEPRKLRHGLGSTPGY